MDGIVVVAFVAFVVSVASPVVVLTFLCTESEPGGNRFGPCPKVIPAHR